MIFEFITTIVPWLLIGFGAWLGYQLLRQNGRILLRLEAIERQLRSHGPARRSAPQGLRIGTVAPDFELPDLAGNLHKLSEYRGRDLMLMFFNPKCGFCSKMAPDLAALPTDGAGGHAVPIIVTTGDPEENRSLCEQHGIRSVVLLQKQMEVASHYQAQGTPMGYRIDSEGRIASELTVGAEPLLKLAGPLSRTPERRASPSASHGKHPDPSLARSRLKRDGLKAGAAAPEFRLPRIDGGELALADFRGERVLLVFSDPECGPCMQLAPKLQELHEAQPDLRVLMVSRREVEANRAKADQLGLSFPIVLQRHWEISREYGMFATPIGYLIDAHGTLMSDVAVGVEAILSLVPQPTRRAAPEPSVNGQAAALAN